MILAFGCALSLFACAKKEAKPESDYYAKLTGGGRKISVRAPVNNEERDVFLFAIDPWQSPSDLSDLEPLKKARVKNSVAEAKVSIKDFNLDEMVCKGYVFAMISEDEKSYAPVSSVYYVINPSLLSKDGKAVDESALSSSIKGLIGTPSELMTLGATSTVVTVDLGKLLSDVGGVGRFSFIFNGLTCHVNEHEIEALDKQIKAYTEAGISVYLEIIQTSPASTLLSSMRSIAFEGVENAQGYAFNMKDRVGATIYCAALKLLCERYSGGEYGRADSFIIGRTVNNSSYFADGLSFEESVKNYAMAVRMAYNLLLAHNKNGKVYISLGNNWNVAESGGHSAKDHLTAFAGIAEEGGDFFWQLCLEANASDASNSSIWNDSLAGDVGQFISPADLSLPITVLSGSSYKCNGMERNLILNRFAIGGGNDQAQAASYAYAYYTALKTGRVNALIYAGAADTATQSGLYSEIGGVTTKKLIAEVFEAVDNEEKKMPDYVSSLIGAKWEKIYPTQATVKTRKTTEVAPAHPSDREIISTIADFTNGQTLGFVPVSASYTELHYDRSLDTNVFYAKLTPSSKTDGAGAITKNIDLDHFKDAGFLTVYTKVESPSESVRLQIRLSGYDKKGTEYVYTSETTLRSGEWSDLCFDVKKFIRNLDGDTLTLCVTAYGDAESLSISEIATEAPDKAEFPWWLVWTVVGILAFGGIVAFVIWFRKNYTFVRE
jgi:hypothetical protein